MRNKNGNLFSRTTAVVCAAIMTSSLMLGGCGEVKEEEKSTDILVETAVPKTENIQLTGDFMGTVEADSETVIMPKTSGDVTGTFFEEGDRVNAGDLLFTIDDAAAQITMAQAEASMQTAQATADNAAVGEQAAQIGLLYTQAQVAETLGTVDTSQMQLENAVASAKYALKAAEENQAISKQQFANAKDNYDDLEDELDDLRDDANQMGKYTDSLKKYKRNYDSIKSAADSSAAEAILSGYGLSLSDVGCSVGDSPADIAAGYINKTTDASSEYELGVMISSSESTESSLRSARSSADSNKDNMLLSQISSAINLETSKNTVLSAQDAKKLAEKMLADYENFTKATIMAGANASIANSNSALSQAQAGVKQADAGKKQAQATMDAAQLQLDYTQVKSPVSGIVTKKSVDVHNMASVGSPAYVIASEDSVNVVFYVSEKVMQAVEEGQNIKLERNGESYDATISENAGVADSESGLFKIKAQVSSQGKKLIDGTSVKITLATEKAENVMTIPVDSVYYENEKAYVFVMQDHKAVRTPVETGVTNSENVEIKSGLKKDSQVITTWAAQLKNGAGVALKDEVTENETETSEVKETSASETGEQ